MSDNSCFDEIEKIADDYKHMSDRAIKTMNGLLQIIAKDLYSKPGHFILELIQNAEDNDYNDGIKPALFFILSKTDPTGTENSSGALIVQNNEIGFNSKNISSICSADDSTKKRIKQGALLEKKG